MPEPVGRISVDFTVWCGRCDDWVHLAAKHAKEAEAEARMLGWQSSKEHGWLCPEHRKEPTTTYPLWLHEGWPPDGELPVRVRLVCGKRNEDGTPCQRYVVGVLGYNGGFEHPKFGRTDLRNFEWRCWQHVSEPRFDTASGEQPANISRLSQHQ